MEGRGVLRPSNLKKKREVRDAISRKQVVGVGN